MRQGLKSGCEATNHRSRGSTLVVFLFFGVRRRTQPVVADNAVVAAGLPLSSVHETARPRFAYGLEVVCGSLDEGPLKAGPLARSGSADLAREDARVVGRARDGEEREEARPVRAEPLVVAEEESP